MGALEVGDGVIVVHDSAVNHNHPPLALVPPAGIWNVDGIDRGCVHCVRRP
jgi:hypothetical protein